MTPPASHCLLTYFRKKKAYPFDLLSFNLTEGLSGFVVLGWQTKDFSPAFPHAHLEVDVVQFAAKSLDHGPQGTSIQPTSSSQGARNNLHM